MKVTREQLVDAFETWNQQILNKEVEVNESPYDGDRKYSESQADYLIELIEKQKE